MISASLILLSLGLIQLHFIPGWENFQQTTFFILVALSVVLALVAVVIYLKNHKRDKSYGILKSIFIVLMYLPLVVLFFFFGVLSTGNYPFGPHYLKTIDLGGRIFYQFESTCAPPDNMCECEDYFTIIYEKNHYLPIMTYKGTAKFYLDDLLLKNDSLLLIANEVCDRDKNKTLMIPLKDQN